MHTYIAEVLTRALHIPAPSPQELKVSDIDTLVI
jgi:hypothetical protein